MKKVLTWSILILMAASVVMLSTIHHSDISEPSKTPNDWFFLQRAFPYSEINYEARNEAFFSYQGKKAEASVIRGEGWVFEGPVNIGGRISALAMPEDDIQTIYAGAASGGIFKSTDGGLSWSPIFEDALSLSIGDIAIAPSDPDVIYVGTGEPNAGGGSITYDGYGIYRSDDAGESWQHLGLENSGSIGRIAVHPNDPMTVYVAAMGRLFSTNEERGVFKSTDGGTTWDQILFESDSTGAIDVVINPDNPDTVFVALWERTRDPDRRVYGGFSSAIKRSFDGGETWQELSSGLPVSSANIGRIGIDLCASEPNVLYAIYADTPGNFLGVYKSTNNGNTWTQTNDGSLSSAYASYGWWFGRIAVDPNDPDVAFVIGFDLYRTSNGGNSWSQVGWSVHVDQHDLVLPKIAPAIAVLGNDGGVYISNDGGLNYLFIEVLPITQFYTCEVDHQYPHRLYGGTQDNGTNRTLSGGTDDWQNIYGGDGFYVLVDPQNNNYVYAEYQYGNFVRSTNGGTGFSSAMNGISSSDRKNWNTPVVFDPNDPAILYYGANRLYRSTNRASSWQAISPDLSNGAGNYNQVYGTITTIAVAPANSDYIYVGTDDGNVWVTKNTGEQWTSIKTGLPERWVTRVAVDPQDENIAYVTLSGYRYDSYQPHIFRTEDAGESWTDITSDLPEAPVNDIIIDPELDSMLITATDFGVYLTYDLGSHWSMLGDNLPNVPVVDLDFHEPSRNLIAATYGRSMYSFSLDQLVDDTEINNKCDLQVYPNPFSQILYIVASDNADCQIFNIHGRMISQYKISVGLNSLYLDYISDGIYFLKINDAYNSHTVKILKD